MCVAPTTGNPLLYHLEKGNLPGPPYDPKKDMIPGKDDELAQDEALGQIVDGPPYRCNFPGCEVLVDRRRDLPRHKKIHDESL